MAGSHAHRRAPDRSGLRRHLRRVQAPAPRTRRPPDPRSRRCAPFRRRRTRAHARRAGSCRHRRRRPTARGRLRLRDGRAARAPARRDDARDHPADGGLPASRCRRRGHPSARASRRDHRPPRTRREHPRWQPRGGHERRPVVVRQRATRARGHGDAVPHRHHAGDQRRVPRVRRGRRLRRRAPLDRGGLGLAARGRARGAAVLAPRGRR